MKQEFKKIASGGFRHFTIKTDNEKCQDSCKKMSVDQSCYGGYTCGVCKTICKYMYIFNTKLPFCEEIAFPVFFGKLTRKLP